MCLFSHCHIQAKRGCRWGGRGLVGAIFPESTVHLVTTHPANPTQLGKRRARPCRRVVRSGNTRPGRKPRRAHTHRVDRGKTPREANTSCVTGSLLARVEGPEATLTPRRLIPSTARPSPSDPQKTPPSDTLKRPSETLSSGPMGPVSAEDGRSFGHRLESRRGKGAT